MKRKSYILITAIISFFLFPAISFAIEKSVKLAGQWPLNYSAKDMATDNDRKYIYLGDGDRLNILDTDLNLISTTTVISSGQIDGIFYSSNQKYIYAACKTAGLHIIDVTDEQNPVEIGAYFPENNSVEIIGVYVDSQRAYLACGISGVLIIDVSNPRNPLYLQEVELPGAWVIYSYAIDVYADGDYVFVADLLNGIRTINVSDLSSPTLTNILLPNTRDLVVSGSTMYSAVEANGMHIIDISDPEKAEQLSIFLTSGIAEAIRVEDNFAYIAYAFGSAGIRVLDVTDKVHPVADKKWSYTESDVKSLDFFPDDTSLYVTSDQTDMKKIDISDKTHMHSIASFDTPADAVAIDVAGSYIYVLDNNVGDTPGKEGLRIHQIVIPNAESIKFDLTGYCATPGEAEDVFVLGRYAYVADGTEGLEIIDLADKTNPKIIKNVSATGYANGVYVSGDFAYVSIGDNGMAILDIKDPVNSSLINVVDTPGYADDVFISNGYAYVADGNQGLQIINIQDKTDPKTVGSVATSGNAAGVFVEGNYAYLAVGDPGLVIVNIADKTHPAILSSLDTPGTAKKISISGSYAYVADGKQGMCLINVSDPAHPVKDDDWSFDANNGHLGDAMDIFSGYSDINENLYAFIADGPAGVVGLHLAVTGNNSTSQNNGGGGGGCFIGTLFN